MPKRQVFYSFHYDNDVMRLHQIRKIGSFDKSELLSPNDWETVERGGDRAIKKWIDDQMNYRSCVIVLIGKETANRKWVKYEIEKAFNDKKGLFGIYIHNLECPNGGKSSKGKNPFEQFKMTDGSKLSENVACYEPNASDPYNDIAKNLETWIETAIAQRG
jgi:MTH538 TIR-like domain (DUF1863)